MKKILASLVLFVIPVFAFAQVANFSTLQSSLASVAGIVSTVIPIVIGIAVLLFIVGLLQYVTAGGDEEKKEAARGTIIYGIIILFVMVSVWGFVRILTDSIFAGRNVQTAPYVPLVPEPRPGVGTGDGARR